MKTASPVRPSTRKGFSLLELTVVIAVLLSLTSILFVGARAWKNGADTTNCVLNMRNVQTSVRSYQNVYGYKAGGMPYAEDGTQDIAVHMNAKGYISDHQLSEITGNSLCPGGGSYSRPHADVFPSLGRLYIECSLATSKGHKLEESNQW